MYDLTTIVQRVSCAITAKQPEATVSFNSLITVRAIYALGFNRYVLSDKHEPHLYDYPPIVSLKINDGYRLMDIPSNLHEIAYGEKFLLPLNIETQPNPARFELGLKYHELFPKIDGDDSQQKPAADITLELLLFGLSK